MEDSSQRETPKPPDEVGYAIPEELRGIHRHLPLAARVEAPPPLLPAPEQQAAPPEPKRRTQQEKVGTAAKFEPAEDTDVQAIVETGQQDTARFLSRLTRVVRFTDAHRELPKLKLDRFNYIRSLALLDRFRTLNNQELAKVFRKPSERIKADRKTPEYRRVLAMIDAATKLLEESQSMVKAAELFEPLMVEEHLDAAFSSGSQRERLAAVSEFTARRSAKKSRDADEGEKELSPATLENLVRVAELLERLRQTHEDPVALRADQPALPPPS